MNVKHLPPGTRASLLRAVAAEKHPKLALPVIAARYGITYDDLRVLIDANGYPDPARMRAAAVECDEQDEAAQIADRAVQKVQGDLAARATTTDDEQQQLRKVRVADLHFDPDNLRDAPSVDDPDIVELADSISELGLLQPITARRDEHGRLIVVMGHRRLTAVRRLRWTTVDVVIRAPMLASDVIAAMLVENGQRRDLNPMEEARGLRRLQLDLAEPDQAEASLTKVARKVGRNLDYVSRRLALLSLSADDQAAVTGGQMSLLEATTKGRTNSGRVGKTGVDRNWHLGPLHNLAQQAKARCQRLKHSRGRTVGGMACGECWESVIRADARKDFVDVGHRTGTCPVCTQPVERKEIAAS